MNGTFYFGNVKHIVSYHLLIFIKFNGRLHDHQFEVRLLEGVLPPSPKRDEGISQISP
jgi:hypothetical protein